MISESDKSHWINNIVLSVPKRSDSWMWSWPDINTPEQQVAVYGRNHRKCLCRQETARLLFADRSTTFRVVYPNVEYRWLNWRGENV